MPAKRTKPELPAKKSPQQKSKIAKESPSKLASSKSSKAPAPKVSRVKKPSPKKAVEGAEGAHPLVGKPAPGFSLSDRAGKKYSLSDIKTEFAVLYFYPRDSTPGCTVEALGFQAMKAKFQKKGATVIGISGGTDKTKEKFCGAHGLDILLLTDSDGSVGAKFGAFGEKVFMGRKVIGFLRKTFVVGKGGKILHVFEKVKPEMHPQEVLDFLDSL